VAKGQNTDRKDVAAFLVGWTLFFLFVSAVSTLVGGAISERSFVEGFRQWPMRWWWIAVPIAVPIALLAALARLWLKNWEERRKGRKKDGEKGG